MMVELVNRLTGTRMRVASEREAEYLAAGHRHIGDTEEKQSTPHASGEGKKIEAGKAEPKKRSAAPKRNSAARSAAKK